MHFRRADPHSDDAPAGSSLHGNAYEYVRNDAFNANTWGRNHTPDIPGLLPNSSVTPFRYNQYGYNVGGPFYIPGKFNKDKSKFFLLGQGRLSTGSRLPATWTVPTALMRTGNFSELLTNNPVNILGKVVQLVDPNTGSDSRQHHPARPSQPQRPGHSEGISCRLTFRRLHRRQQHHYVTALHPQDQRKDTLAVDMNLTDKQRLQFRRNNYAFFRIPASRRHTDRRRRSTSIVPTRPTRLTMCGRSAPTRWNELLATVAWMTSTSRLTSSLLRSHHRRHQLSVHLPSGKLIPTRIPTANITV